MLPLLQGAGIGLVALPARLSSSPLTLASPLSNAAAPIDVGIIPRAARHRACARPSLDAFDPAREIRSGHPDNDGENTEGE